MKNWFLAAALLAPMLTLAQEAPPAAYYPGQQRDTWYIGFGLGTGDGSLTRASTSYTFKEANFDRSPSNLFLNFKVGATMSPRLLLGLDITALRSTADQGGFTSAVQVTNTDAVVTFFPMERGLYLRGGVGLSSMVVSADGFSDSTARGANILLGAGYAFWLGQKFNLTVGLDFSAQNYGSSNDQIEDSKMWALWVGADWY
jgi:hypothetical protein